MYGLSARERRGLIGGPTLLDRIVAEGVSAMRSSGDEVNIRGYLDVMLEGSFPEPALRTPPRSRGRWFDGYIEQMITRDVPAIAPRRDPELLRRYLSALAVNSAGLVTEESLRGAAGINAQTAREYQALFQRMFVLDVVPAWFSNRIKRLVRRPSATSWTPPWWRRSSAWVVRRSCAARTCSAASWTRSSRLSCARNWRSAPSAIA
jgi:uncharacterized protein